MAAICATLFLTGGSSVSKTEGAGHDGTVGVGFAEFEAGCALVRNGLREARFGLEPGE